MSVEEKKKKLPYDDDDLFLTRVSALLDFFSDKAVAHASFFVASIFGVVTLLALIQGFQRGHIITLLIWTGHISSISTIPFFAVSYAGYYALNRFGYFADLSDKLTLALRLDETLGRICINPDKKEEEQESLLAYKGRRENVQRRLLLLRMLIERARSTIGGAYWAAIFVMAAVTYSRFWTSIEEFLVFSVGFAGFFAVFVLIPLLYTRN